MNLSSTCRRGRRLLALGLLLVAYGLVLSCAHLSNRFVLYPSTRPIDAHGATRRVLAYSIKPNGGEPQSELEIWQATSRLARQRGGDAELFVLRFYGNGDRAESEATAEAEAWDERAVELWCMNYPGYGGSRGPARLNAVGPAALAVFDAMKAHAGARPIVISGYSFGTAAALYVAAQRPGAIAALVLHNPPAIRQMILGSHGWWNLWLLAGPVARGVPPTLDSVANARRVRDTPAIFLLAEKDDYVLPKYQRMVATAYAGPKRLITLPAAGHETSVTGRAWEEFRAALQDVLPRRRAAGEQIAVPRDGDPPLTKTRAKIDSREKSFPRPGNKRLRRPS